MTTTAKLLLTAIGAAALATSPALARTHHVQTHRSTEHAARGQVGPFASPAYNDRSDQLLISEGYQRDRQMVGHGTGGGPAANE